MNSSSDSQFPDSRALRVGFRIFTFVYFLGLFLTIGYIWTFAQDRYTTSAAFKISRQDIASTTLSALSSLAIPGVSDSGSMESQIVIGYLQSADLLTDVEEKLGLEKHYNSPSKDWFFRLKDDAPLEKRLEYYRKFITAEYDPETGLTVISAESFDPEVSRKIVDYLLRKSDEFINGLNRSIADQRLSFIHSELDRAEKNLIAANQEVLDFQNVHNLISPEEAISDSLAAVQSLRMQRLNTSGQLATLVRESPESPRIDSLKSRLASLDELIEQEIAKLSGPEKGRLNKLLAEYQRLTLNLDFATEIRKGVQQQIEKTRIEAIATSRFFSVIQHPYLPQEPSAPRPWYASLTIFILGFFLFLILRGLAKSAMERI